MYTQKSILGFMGLDSIEEGTKVYIYRVYHGEFISEEGLANVKNREIQNYLCGRYNEEGVLTSTCKVHPIEGEAWSSGGSYTIWFFKANKRKAKKVFRKKITALRDSYQDRANRMTKIIDEELK